MILVNENRSDDNVDNTSIQLPKSTQQRTTSNTTTFEELFLRRLAMFGTE